MNIFLIIMIRSKLANDVIKLPFLQGLLFQVSTIGIIVLSKMLVNGSRLLLKGILVLSTS